MYDKKFSQPSASDPQQRFSNVPRADIPRSKFDRSSGYKTTLSASRLYPIYVDEVLPGDTFDMKATVFGRMATPLHPLMDNLWTEVHWFFVPNRLIWDNWELFMGERKNVSDDPNSVSVPQAAILVTQSNFDQDKLWNHIGIPVRSNDVGFTAEVSALPFRAYDLIYNDWYRDQNFIDEVTIYRGDDIDNTYNARSVHKRGKRKDYFTSCLPWPQKGDPVEIPLGDKAPVATESVLLDGQVLGIKNGLDGTDYHLMQEGGTTEEFLQLADQSGSIKASGGVLHADLKEATAVTINDLRTAFQIQKLLERDARGGTRYIELILSHFGVTSDDARLQRPEFLGGGSSGVDISPVPSTVAAVDAPQAELAAYGTLLNRSGFEKSFTEHGFIMGIASIRADLTYQHGLERFWSRKTRYDYYWPALSHLGEQPVYNKEIYLTGDPGIDDLVFGYQERYAEYRYKQSRIAGQLSSESGASLDAWHLAQDYDVVPNLGESFIEENVPMNRVVAVPAEPDFIVDCDFKCICDRPMPVYSVPGLIDHF